MKMVEYPCATCHETETEACYNCSKTKDHLEFIEKANSPLITALSSCNLPLEYKQQILDKLEEKVSR